MASARVRATEISAVRWLLSRQEQHLRAGALAGLAVAAVLGVLGGTWDAAWHVTLRRETFWSPPHLLLYSGTSIALFAALLAVANAGLRGRSLWTAEPGFVVAAIGAAVVIGAAPLDDFWHRTFGRDVDVWSFPHLVALGGGVGINVGAALACRQRLNQPEAPAWTRAALLVFLTALLWVSMFAMNWYTLVLARTRDSFQYPLLVSLVAPAVMVFAHWIWGRFGATVVTVCYMGYVIAAHGLLSVWGFALLPFPPLLLAAAVGVDLAVRNPEHPLARSAGAGMVFVPLFLAAEAASLAWYPHPALPVPQTQLAMAYFAAAGERPWDLEHLNAALPFVLLAGAAGGTFGGLVVGWSRRLVGR